MNRAVDAPTPGEWYKAAFAADYVRLYAHRNAAEAAAALTQLAAWAPLPPPGLCLDLCCGFGRHLTWLRARGAAVVGVDLSGDLLRLAAAPDAGGRGRVAQADMRRLPFSCCFDTVLSFFSSFGYFADDAENLAALREAARVLRPGGRLLLDFLNADHVRAHLRPSDEQGGPDGRVTQRRWLDAARRTVEKEVVVQDAAGTRRYRESVKLYTLDDFAAMFAAAGLRLVRAAGTYDGAPPAADAPRLILLGEKRADGPA